jgi:hypothetical protein
MARAQTWVTDLKHFIDEETEDWADLPGPALNLAIALGSIVAWVTDHLPAGEPHTNVPCWRRPGRKRCRGDILAERPTGSSEIVWHCWLCGDNGVIHGWEDTLWDRRAGVDTDGAGPIH